MLLQPLAPMTTLMLNLDLRIHRRPSIRKAKLNRSAKRREKRITKNRNVVMRLTMCQRIMAVCLVQGIALKIYLPNQLQCIEWDGTWTRGVKDGCAMVEQLDFYAVRRFFCLPLIRSWWWRNKICLKKNGFANMFMEADFHEATRARSRFLVNHKIRFASIGQKEAILNCNRHNRNRAMVHSSPRG